MKKPKRYSPKKSGARQFSRPQPSARQKGYDKDWDIYRYRYLHHNKKCYACGTSRGSLHLDHIVPHKGDSTLFWNESNIIPLCHSCHSIVTSLFDRQDPPDTKGKLKWLDDERKRMGVKVRVKVVPMPKHKKG